MRRPLSGARRLLPVAAALLFLSGCSLMNERYSTFEMSRRFFAEYGEAWEARPEPMTERDAFGRGLWQVFAVPVAYPFVLAADVILLPGTLTADTIATFDEAAFDALYLPGAAP